MMVRNSLGYTVLCKDQWELVRNMAHLDERLYLFPQEKAHNIDILRKEDDELIASLGSIPHKDYYWMSFLIIGEGCDLLKRSFVNDADGEMFYN